jgi:hypothetical protein
MADNGSTAEHQLLKAIEGKAALSPRRSAGIDESREKLLLLWTEWQKNFSVEDLKKKLDLPGINKALLGLIAALFAIQVFVSAKGMVRLENVPRFKVSGQKTDPGEARVMTFPLKEYSYYVDALLDRNIFLPREEDAAVPESTVSEADSTASKLRLVGISWSDDPDKRFVMIEDASIELTYYLQEGETILGFKVDKISREKVMLNHSGKEIQLR